MERKTSSQTIYFTQVWLISIPASRTLRAMRSVSTFLNMQILKVHHSTLVHTSLATLNPWFVTGFIDAEGCFSILIQHNIKFKTNWRVKAIFAIGLHKQDISILKEIQSVFGGVGSIHQHGKDSVQSSWTGGVLRSKVGISRWGQRRS